MLPSSDRATDAHAWALTLLVCAAPFLFGCVEPWSRALLQLGVFALVATRLSSANGELRAPPAIAWAAGFLALGGLVQLSGGALDLAGPAHWAPATASPWATRHAVLLWGTFTCIAWQAASALRSGVARTRLAWAVFLSGLLFVMVGVVQWSTDSRSIYGLRPFEWPRRTPFGPYYNKGHAAGLLILCANLGIGLFLSRFHLMRGRLRIGVWADFVAIQAMILGGLLAMAYGLWLATSRASLHAFVLGWWLTALLAAVGFSRGWRRVLWIAVVVALGYGYWEFVQRYPILMGIKGDRFDQSTQERLAIWRASLLLLRDRWLFGSGLGAFEFAHNPYQESGVIGVVEHAHNDWIELACGMGLVGGLLPLALLVRQWAQAVRDWWAEPDSDRRALVAGSLAAGQSFGVHSLFDFNLQTPASAALLVAVVAAFWSRRGSALELPRGMRRPLVLAPAAAAIVACLPVVSWVHAQRARTDPPSSLAYRFTRALRWDPGHPRYAFSLGASYLQLANGTPSASRPLSLLALRASESGLRSTPNYPPFFEVSGGALWRLGRPADGKALVVRHMDLRPWDNRYEGPR